MAVEQIRPDSRAEQGGGSRRKILTSARGLRFFSKSPAAQPILLFQCHATSKMRGCLRDYSKPQVSWDIRSYTLYRGAEE